MWMSYPSGPFSVLAGIWGALSGAIANLLTGRRIPAALLTGLLVSQLPRIEMLLQRQPFYPHVLRLQARVLGALYRFRERREREEYERERRETIERLGFDPEVGPPRPATLLRVIPVGRTVRLEDATLMALSVESYAEGFVAHLRLLTDEVAPRPDRFAMRFDHTFVQARGLSVRDDGGRRYPVMESGGGGDGEWRFEYRSTESIDPEARELVLELAELRWERFDHGHGEPRLDRVQTGPWRFAVPL